MNMIKMILLSLTVVLLTACGGGGGGGDSGGGTTIPKGAFSLDKSTLNFSQQIGTQTEQELQINITGSGVTYLVAGYDSGQVEVSWLDFESTGSGTQYRLRVRASTYSLNPGEYSASFTIGTGDKDGNALQKRVVNVRLSVTDNFAFYQPTFESYASAGKNAEGRMTSFPFAGKAAAAWTASASAEWLVISKTTGTGPGELMVGADTRNLAPGTYTASLQIAENGNATNKTTLTYTLHVVAPLAFHSAPGELVFVQERVANEYRASLSFTGDGQTNWIASTDIPWLTIPVNEGKGAGSIDYVMSPNWLNLGSYTGRVALLDKLDFANVTYHNLTIHIESPIRFSAEAHSQLQTLQAAPFVYGSDANQLSLELPFTAGAHAQWRVSSTAAWLRPTLTQGVGSGSVPVTIATQGLPVGTYTATLQIVDDLNERNQESLTVTIVVAPPTLTLSESSVLLGGVDGLAGAQGSLAFAINTGANGYSYNLAVQTEANGDWLSLGSSSGLVTEAGIEISLTPATTLVSGTHQANLALQVQVGDQTLQRTIPLTYNKEASRLVASNVGVAFTAAPSRSVLTRTLKIESSIERNGIPWTAVADQPWLSVTPSGTTGGELTLTADDSLLAAGTYIAQVRVSSSDRGVENQEVIRVGLTVLDADPQDLALNLASTMSSFEAVTGGAHFGIVASPVEPLIFVSLGSQIIAYDQFTGDAVRTFSPTLGSASTMAISQDGTRLYVYDPVNLKVVELDSSSGQVIHRFSVVPSEYSWHGNLMPGYFRPNGRPLLMVGGGLVYDLTTYEQAVIEGGYHFYFRSISTNQNPNWVAFNDGSLVSYFYSALGGGNGVLKGEVRSSVSYAQGREGQACVNAAGTRLYTASGAPYEFPGVGIVSQTLEQTLPATSYPNSLQCGWNGVLVGGTSSYYDEEDIFVYNTVTGQLLGKFNSSTRNGYRYLLDRGLALSSDNQRLGALSYSESTLVLLRLINLPAIE